MARTQKNCTRKIFMTQIATMGMITLECDHILKCEVRRDLGSVACMLNHLSGVRLFPTLWTVAHQAPLSVGFSKQESWSGLPCPSSGDLPNPGIEPRSRAWQVDLLLLGPPQSFLKSPNKSWSLRLHSPPVNLPSFKNSPALSVAGWFLGCPDILILH